MAVDPRRRSATLALASAASFLVGGCPPDATSNDLVVSAIAVCDMEGGVSLESIRIGVGGGVTLLKSLLRTAMSRPDSVRQCRTVCVRAAYMHDKPPESYLKS